LRIALPFLLKLYALLCLRSKQRQDKRGAPFLNRLPPDFIACGNLAPMGRAGAAAAVL